jgi:hypothetical protein
MSDVADPTLETTDLTELPDQGDQDTDAIDTPAGTVTPTVVPKETDELRTAMADLATTVNRIAQPKEPELPPPTKEQIAEYWKVYDPEASDKEFFKKWFRLNPEATAEEVQQAKEMFAGVQRGLMMQAITAAKNYIAEERRNIDRDYGPLREYVQTAKQEATRGRFYSEYQSLNDARFNAIIDATARALDNKEFANEGEYFKALAEGAAGSIKAILPEFDLGAKQQPKPKPGQTPKLPRTTAGGGGGAGKGAHDALQPTGRKNDIDSLDEPAE